MFVCVCAGEVGEMEKRQIRIGFSNPSLIICFYLLLPCVCAASVINFN